MCYLSYLTVYNTNKDTSFNVITPEVQGFRRHKWAQMKGNVAEMVYRNQKRLVVSDIVGGIY